MQILPLCGSIMKVNFDYIFSKINNLYDIIPHHLTSSYHPSTTTLPALILRIRTGAEFAVPVVIINIVNVGKDEFKN